MASLTHGFKKRMSRATTRSKTITKNISSDYTIARNLLLRQKTAVEASLKHIDSAKSSWMDVMKTQKELAERLQTEAEVDSEVYGAVDATAQKLRECQTELSASDPASAPVSKVISKIKSFVSEVESIEKEFKDVETSYTEVARYEKKVEKLNSKKKDDKVKSNLDKLAGSRAVYQSKIDGIVAKMNKTSGKFDTVMKMIIAVFWGSEDKYLNIISKNSATTREAAVADLPALAELDLNAIEVAKVDSLPTPTEVPALPAAETPAAEVTEDVVEKAAEKTAEKA